MTSPWFAINTKTLDVVPVSKIKPFNVLNVPFYGWSFAKALDRLYHLVMSHHVNTVGLQDWEIQFPEDVYLGKPVWYDNHEVVIRYPYKGGTNELKLEYHPVHIQPRQNVFHRLGDCFDITENGVTKSHQVVYSSFVSKYYTIIDGLFEAASLSNSPYGGFYVGLRNRPYRLIYKGKDLNKEMLAYLYGCWAILLNDDYTFNTLVLLHGATDEELDIAKLWCTSDWRMTKTAVMLGYANSYGVAV